MVNKHRMCFGVLIPRVACL